MTYIFLSYAKADRDAALAMRDVLRREGLSSVWMDENFHELNNEHWPAIEANILSAGAFVLLLSDAAKKSKWVNRELSYAEQIGKPIFSILIQGEAWARLKNEPLRPSLGASLDLPDEFAALVKTLDSPYANLPEQIPPDTVKAAVRPPYKLAISIALVLAVILMLARLYNSATEAAYVASLTSDAEARQMTDEYIVSSNNTAQANNQLRTQDAHLAETVAVNRTETEIAATATMRVISAETAQIARMTDIAATATMRVISAEHTQIAIRTEIAATALAPTVIAAANTQQASAVNATNTEQASTVAVANTHQANMNLTAVAGNGTLPCTATVRMVGSSIRLTVYTAPDKDTISDPLRFSVAYTLTLTEWVVNSDGVWYGLRLYPDDLATYAYIPAEDLILDEDCPR